MSFVREEKVISIDFTREREREDKVVTLSLMEIEGEERMTLSR